MKNRKRDKRKRKSVEAQRPTFKRRRSFKFTQHSKMFKSSILSPGYENFHTVQRKRRRSSQKFRKFTLNDSRLDNKKSNDEENIIIDLTEPSTSGFSSLEARGKQVPHVHRELEIICLDSDDEGPSSSVSPSQIGETVRKALNESGFIVSSHNDLFFEDRGTEFKNSDVPIYTITTAELNGNDNHDDTLILNESLRASQSENDSHYDNSVIFINEEKLVENPTTAEFGSSFIPLPQGSPKRKKLRRRTSKANAQSENSQELKENTVKRLVIIDGSNVAFAHGNTRDYSVRGIELAIEHFEKLGHEVKAIVPQFRFKKSCSTDQLRLEQLKNEGKIVVTPGKDFGKDKQKFNSYDDRFILEAAAQLDACVISNDNYRDLIGEKASFKEIIENRVIGFTFFNDLFLIPPDPYGRIGPKTNEILNK